VPPEGRNRRTTDRYKTNNLLRLAEEIPEDEITVEEFDAAALGVLETLDLSAGGCAVFSPKPMPLNTEVCLSIRLDDHVLAVRGRTVRARRTKHEGNPGWRVGVEFVALDPMERDGIDLYLSETGADLT
jgi:c-di-GMP-binding flagellar brake protein YcgR